MKLRSWIQLAVLVAAGVAWTGAGAEEVHSNGAGGGAWSDPLSWRTKAVPGTNDVVTVAGDDLVVVDLTDPKRIACRELNVDPRGMLSFKQGAGKIVLNVGGLVEAYGAIRMDMSRSDDDSAELRLAGATIDKRVLRLARGGSLVVGGRAGLPEGRGNATLRSGPIITDTNAPPVDPTGRFEAQDGTSVDLRGAAIRDLQMVATGLDNTGAAPGERINVVGCRFSGTAWIQVVSCDTPLLADNEFATEVGVPWALYVYVCTLAEVRGNTIRGSYAEGIVINSSDTVVLSNTVTGTTTGYAAHQPNLMLKQNVARKCGTGYYLVNAVAGVAEDCVADACGLGFQLHNTAGLQLIGAQAINVATNATTLNALNSQLTFLNCGIATNQAIIVQTPTRTLETQDYLVVHVTGQVPAGSQVALVTATPEKPLPPGAADPNVRNSPAAIGPGGWTPLPQSLAALSVRSWLITPDNRRLPPPDYILRVLGPAPGTNAPPPVLKEMRVKPAPEWYRPSPNELKATIEVTVP